MSLEKLTKKELIQRVQELESILEQTEFPTHKGQSGSSASVPENFKQLFDDAELKVASYYKQLKFQPNKGTIDINGERYLLVRSSAFSYDFFHTVINMYSDKTIEQAFVEGRDFLSDIAHVIGTEDAKGFHRKLNLKTPIEKLSAGPIHFAYTGWAFVDILPDSNPSIGPDFVLKYDHPFSFEADAWIKKGKKSHYPVCVMNAAYSAAWCKESFGFNLVSVEVTCRAKGDEKCSFIMAPPDQIHKHLDSYQKQQPIGKRKKNNVPFFFDRKAIEQRMMFNDQMLNDAQAMAKIGSWHFDLEQMTLLWSDQMYAIFEVSKDVSNLYTEYLNLHTPDVKEKLELVLNRMIQFGENYDFKYTISMPDGRVKWLSSSGVAIYDEGNKVVGLKGVVQDVTDDVIKEIELNSFFDVTIDLMCIANDQGYFLKISPSWSKLLGYSTKELCTKPFTDFIHPEDKERTFTEMNRLNDGESVVNFENRYRCSNGDYVTLNWNATPNTSIGLIYCIARNVTKQKQNESQLKLIISEKEMLLKEIHHRVKNNLQVISSLLSLQSKMNSSNMKLQRLYEDSMNRIKSMAALHELFYQSKNINKIDFSDYCHKLSTDLLHSFVGEKHNITTVLSIKEVFINLDTAVPLGLIINEIITNSLKHGFVNLKKGEIYISMSRDEQQDVCLEIGDNGVGITKKIDEIHEDSMGFFLIQNLTEQLDGKMVQDFSKKGTHFKFSFKEQ